MKSTILLASIASLMLLTACYPVRRSEPIVGPMTTADASIKRGEKLYDEHCYRCHAVGEGGLAPSFNDKPLPRSLIRFQIRHGLGAMPAFDEHHLSDQEVDDIVEYVIALRQHGIKR